MEWFSEVHRARTLVPTLVIAEMAAITINPAMSAYSSTSPPPSSFKHSRISLLIRTSVAIGKI